MGQHRFAEELFEEATGESQGGYLGNESLAGTQGPRREKRVTKSAGGETRLFSVHLRKYSDFRGNSISGRALKGRDGKVNVTFEIATS